MKKQSTEIRTIKQSLGRHLKRIAADRRLRWVLGLYGILLVMYMITICRTVGRDTRDDTNRNTDLPELPVPALPVKGRDMFFDKLKSINAEPDDSTTQTSGDDLQTEGQPDCEDYP